MATYDEIEDAFGIGRVSARRMFSSVPVVIERDTGKIVFDNRGVLEEIARRAVCRRYTAPVRADGPLMDYVDYVDPVNCNPRKRSPIYLVDLPRQAYEDIMGYRWRGRSFAEAIGREPAGQGGDEAMRREMYEKGSILVKIASSSFVYEDYIEDLQGPYDPSANYSWIPLSLNPRLCKLLGAEPAPKKKLGRKRGPVIRG
jgi:hypothetical protein